MFVDRCQIELQAGRGGDGCMSFRRERYVPQGGPNGGDGGCGGSIIIEAREGVDHLSALAHRKIWRAPKGMHGEGSNRTGRQGEDLVIHVPPGTVIIDAQNDFVIRDLTADGDSFVIARGGKGGRGNASFKGAQNQAPRQFTRGDEGEHRVVIFELKAIADVGLIGKPNAGKSTLLSRLSHARPEIADYPFTTKHPNLGRVQLDLDRSFVMADIPGLIEGAHEGVGLGHEFLRHVERAGVLVHLVEPMPMDGTDPLENYRSIRDELTEYKVKLGERPEVIAITKAELPGAKELRDQLAEQTGKEVFLISAVTGEGLNKLTGAIARMLQEQATS
ncbi:MAG: GTPase ObgE [Planctomycetaceae bacterium]|nr:GTPase ObgE [Planctomycetales bacterium]MCB9873803.1 GTPase ObgE [Planctomycetaceae bacterium]MCB9939706.1 GTPase ObgE [Planctomycetaceae bacterium]